MTDPKKNPNKNRRSFFWQRRPQLPPELPKPTISGCAAARGATLVSPKSAEGR